MNKVTARLSHISSMALALTLLPAMVLGNATVPPLDQDQLSRIDQALQAMLINLATDPQLTPLHSGTWKLEIERDPELLPAFGAIFSTDNDQSSRELGPLLLAVTPRSAASKMGLRTGDRVKSVNSVPMIDTAAPDPQGSPFARLQAVLTALEDHQTLQMEVARNGSLIQLEGAMMRLRLPAVKLILLGNTTAPADAIKQQPEAEAREACATVSMYERPPSTAEGLHGAGLASINGKAILHEMRDFQYLAPGSYTFLLNDNRIPERYLRRRHLKSSRGQLKPITITIEDGMIYHLGARLLDEENLPDNEREFWQPVVWRLEPGWCKGRAVSR